MRITSRHTAPPKPILHEVPVAGVRARRDYFAMGGLRGGAASLRTLHFQQQEKGDSEDNNVWHSTLRFLRSKRLRVYSQRTRATREPERMAEPYTS